MSPIRATSSLPDAPEPIAVAMSSRHHVIAPPHSDEVAAYLKDYPAATPVDTIEQPKQRDELAEIAATPVDQDPSRHEGEYIELIGRHEKVLHDIAHGEPKVRTHGYVLLFFGMVLAFIFSDLSLPLRAVAYITCAAMIGVGIGLLMTKIRATALKLMLSTFVLEVLTGIFIVLNPYTALLGILVLIMLGYTIATIRDVNDVA